MKRSQSDKARRIKAILRHRRRPAARIIWLEMRLRILMRMYCSLESAYDIIHAGVHENRDMNWSRAKL